MLMKIWDREEKRFVDSQDELMKLVGFDVRIGYEAIGLQDDGTPVVFDKCGNFGYLDPQRFRCVVDLST